MILAVAVATAALAQTRVADPSVAVQQAQYRASAAYGELREAQYQLKLTEQDYVNTQDAYRAAQKSADAIKSELDKTKKALDAAKAREARARKDYDTALDAVEKAWGRSSRK